MKRTLLFTVFSALLLAPASFTASAEVIAPVDISNTSCKGWDYTRSFGETDPSWTVGYNDGRLTVTWHDFVANCCPMGFGSDINVEDGKIIFRVWEEGYGMCDCVCPFDVTSSYEGVAPGRYELIFNGETKAEVDLQEGLSRFLSSLTTSVDNVSAPEATLAIHNDVIKAVCPGKFRIDVCNASGILIHSFTDSDSAELTLGSLSSGVYFIRLTSSAGKILTLPVRR